MRRYWHTVAYAADSHVGPGHVQLVLADKNLVPAPRDNLDSVSSVLNKSGGCWGRGSGRGRCMSKTRV